VAGLSSQVDFGLVSYERLVVQRLTCIRAPHVTNETFLTVARHIRHNRFPLLSWGRGGVSYFSTQFSFRSAEPMPDQVQFQFQFHFSIRRGNKLKNKFSGGRAEFGCEFAPHRNRH
jgi:hypothetical protein